MDKTKGDRSPVNPRSQEVLPVKETAGPSTITRQTPDRPDTATEQVPAAPDTTTEQVPAAPDTTTEQVPAAPDTTTQRALSKHETPNKILKKENDAKPDAMQEGTTEKHKNIEPARNEAHSPDPEGKDNEDEKSETGNIFNKTSCAARRMGFSHLAPTYTNALDFNRLMQRQSCTRSFSGRPFFGALNYHGPQARMPLVLPAKELSNQIWPSAFFFRSLLSVLIMPLTGIICTYSSLMTRQALRNGHYALAVERSNNTRIVLVYTYIVGVFTITTAAVTIVCIWGSNYTKPPP